MKLQEVERKYAETAKRLYHEEGELEFDDKAKVSISEDDGAYVQCWMWVPRTTVGVSKAAQKKALKELEENRVRAEHGVYF